MAVQSKKTPPLPDQDPDAHVIDDIEALKALADPLRMRLLFETGDQPRTVKELAAVLDVPQTRLYYHVGILLKNKLLRVAGRRMVSGIEERSYVAVAKSFTPSRRMMSAIVESGMLSALLDLAGAEMALALSEDSMVGDPTGTVPVLGLTQLAMTREDVEEFQRRYIDLQESFGYQPGTDKPEYHLVFMAYRIHGSPVAKPARKARRKRAP